MKEEKKKEEIKEVEITMKEKSSKAEQVEILKKQIEKQLREQAEEATEEQIQIKLAEMEEVINKIVEEEKTDIGMETHAKVGFDIKIWYWK